MKINTHKKINKELCGKPILADDDCSKVEMYASDEMAVDETGLVHGGFIFGLADHAAMIAVNHPNVVLGASEVKFLKPVKIGDTVLAEAIVEEIKGKKSVVKVIVTRGSDQVFSGEFTCFILERHVLK